MNDDAKTDPRRAPIYASIDRRQRMRIPERNWWLGAGAFVLVASIVLHISTPSTASPTTPFVPPVQGGEGGPLPGSLPQAAHALAVAPFSLALDASVPQSVLWTWPDGTQRPWVEIAGRAFAAILSDCGPDCHWHGNIQSNCGWHFDIGGSPGGALHEIQRGCCYTYTGYCHRRWTRSSP